LRKNKEVAVQRFRESRISSVGGLRTITHAALVDDSSMRMWIAGSLDRGTDGWKSLPG
jgi:hypothetical protein